MIAPCAERAWLQVVEGHVIRKTADVQFGVVMTARIAATDEHSVSTVTSHVGQRYGLAVKVDVFLRDLGNMPATSVNCHLRERSQSPLLG
jgi:hypothetical protein